MSSASPYAGTHTEVKRLRIAKRMSFVLLMLLYYTAIVNFWKERDASAAVRLIVVKTSDGESEQLAISSEQCRCALRAIL